MKLGLTGDIGSGKSTVLKLFESHGFQTISADAIVHDLLENNESLVDSICSALGEDLKKETGGIHRAKLAAIIFNDPEARFLVEGILHPRVRQVWEEFCRLHSDKNVVVEIPLLFEKNLEKSFDSIVTVYASFEVKSKRLQERGMDEADIRARLDAQIDQETKADRSDFLILNNGSLGFLAKQVSECVTKLKKS